MTTTDTTIITEGTTPQSLLLTDGAIAKLATLLAEENEPALGLRVAVRPGGCSGFSYEMYFDAETVPDDQVATFDGVTVRVDATSAPLLAGATLDYRDGLQDTGFSIDNPNAQRSCGCGQSFS
ncbi:MAG: HesB/IscA family protein [Acidimicrobiales bacterium]